MKFTVEAAVASGGRVGKLSSVGLCGGTVTVQTPLCTLFTKGGSVPYLSLDMLKRISRVPDIATIPLGSLAEHEQSVSASGKGLGEFTAMKDRLIFLTLHDASKPVPSGKNDKAGIAVWGKGGKVKVEPPLYRKILATFQPDLALALGDADTDRDCGRKRLTKAVNKTLDFLDDTSEKPDGRGEMPSFKGSVIGSVVGGFSVEERKRSARETAARPVQGFCVEGFEKGHSGVDLLGSEDFANVLEATLSELPPDKPRIMETVWSPLQVVKAFRMGVDIFSSAYPHTLTEKGCAMVSTHNLPPGTQPPSPEEPTSDTALPQDRVLNLNDKRFFDDFGPVMSRCDCYTCQNFTRSYIHHLLNTSELLAYVLLTIHNFHCYFEFFDRLREAASDNRVEELEKFLAQQGKSSSL